MHPSSMRAAVYHRPRDLRVEKRDVPPLGPQDVLVEVSHCGVCGTDLHLVLEGMGAPGSIGGHEYSGTIRALGDEVEGWGVGDLIVGAPAGGCGQCDPCLARRPSLCVARLGFDPHAQGAFAEYVVLRASGLRRVPASLSARHAALAEPLAVALHAVDIGQARPGERALVTGAGPIGLLVVAALRALGISEVAASERASARRERAARVGASQLFEPESLKVPPIPFSYADPPFDVVFECSGNPAALEAGLAQLRPMGRLVIVGSGAKRPRLDHNRVLVNELAILGSYEHGADGFERALALLASGALPIDELIEPADLSLGELLPAMEALERGEITRKVLVAPKLAEAR